MFIRDSNVKSSTTKDASFYQSQFQNMYLFELEKFRDEKFRNTKTFLRKNLITFFLPLLFTKQAKAIVLFSEQVMTNVDTECVRTTTKHDGSEFETRRRHFKLHGAGVIMFCRPYIYY